MRNIYNCLLYDKSTLATIDTLTEENGNHEMNENK